MRLILLALALAGCVATVETEPVDAGPDAPPFNVCTGAGGCAGKG